MRQLQEKGAEFRALEPTGDIRHILATTTFIGSKKKFEMESSKAMLGRKMQFFLNFFSKAGLKNYYS
jgi:hypothetical protein